MDPKYLIIPLVILLLLSAFFSSSETAFTSFNEIRMKKFAKTSKSAKIALKLKEKYDNLLTTILIGNNIVNIVGTTIATYLFIATDFNTAIGSLIVTVVILIFGEIFPKTFANTNPEKFAITFAIPLMILYYIFLPFSLFFSLLKQLILKIFNKDNDNDVMSDEEFEIFIDEIRKDGTLNKLESNIIKNTLEYGDLQVEDIMTKSKDVIFVKDSDSLEYIQDVFERYNYSRLPISKTKSINDIHAIIYQKEFYEMLLNDETQLENILVEPLITKPRIKISRLLQTFQRENIHMAVVKNPKNRIVGIITLEDIVEELVGEIEDEYDEERDLAEQEDKEKEEN